MYNFEIEGHSCNMYAMGGFIVVATLMNLKNYQADLDIFLQAALEAEGEPTPITATFTIFDILNPFKIVI